MSKWYVTIDKQSSYIDDPSECVWTVSRDPNATGWCTDSGHPGYGLTRADAEELANAANEIERLRDVLYEWDALIEHQYTGSREAMSDMTYAAQATAALLYGKEPWPQKTRVEKQAEEIKRLRAALVYISVASEPHRHAPTYTVEHLHGVIGAMKTRACAALAGEAKDDAAP